MIARACLAFLFAASAVVACSSNKSQPDGGTGGACAQDLSVGWTDDTLCAPGTGGNLGSACPPVTPAQSCLESKPVAACCAWVQDPKNELARAPSSLHNYGAPNGDLAVDLSCIDTPATQGTPQTVTLVGYLKVFVGSDQDSAGVKVEIFQEGTDGALGAPVGTAVTTDTTSPSRTNTWLSGCPTDGCTERQFTYANIPTETPLIIHTSDGKSAGKWYDFYDYNVYFSNASVSGGQVTYDTTAVGTTDPLTVTATVGTSVSTSKGLLAGEVHDCGDVRLSGAMVNTDVRGETDMFYFTSDETNPTPDLTASTNGQGTSDLGLFGALNYQPGVPIHISAVGLQNGQRKLIGAYTVQVFAGAVTGLSLRGRRPYQH
ncbi:MAG TPA: hypothetical protein VGH28_25130 [Polyangiaceae bacterium]|jgi:hypothetical protein